MRGYNLAEKVARLRGNGPVLVRGVVLILVFITKKAASPRQTSAGCSGFLVAAKEKRLGGGALLRNHQATFGYRDFYTRLRRETSLRQPLARYT